MLSLVTGVRGIFITLLFAGVVALLLRFYHRKMGCITGDMLGAMVEVTEAVLFLGAGMSL